MLGGMTNEIKIIPIFNQSEPGIWSDFVLINNASVSAAYGLVRDDAEIQNILRTYEREWKTQYGAKFAFAAYDGADMVGYVKGQRKAHETKVEDLFVLPEYQGARIGSRLLAAAEAESSIALRPNMCLTSYGSDKALNFYKHRGYTPLGSVNYFSKKPARARCTILPVFHVNSLIATDCEKIANLRKVKFNKKELNVSHAPIFAYVDVEGRVGAYAIGDEKYENVIDVQVAPQQGPRYDWMRKYVENRLREIRDIKRMRMAAESVHKK